MEYQPASLVATTAPGLSAPPPFSSFQPILIPYSVQQPGGMRPDRNDMPAYHPRPLPILIIVFACGAAVRLELMTLLFCCQSLW